MIDNPQPETQFVPDRTRGTGSIFPRPGGPNLYIQGYSFGRVRQESCGSPKLAVAKRLLRNRLADAHAALKRNMQKVATS